MFEPRYNEDVVGILPEDPSEMGYMTDAEELDQLITSLSRMEDSRVEYEIPKLTELLGRML